MIVDPYKNHLHKVKEEERMKKEATMVTPNKEQVEELHHAPSVAKPSHPSHDIPRAEIVKLEEECRARSTMVVAFSDNNLGRKIAYGDCADALAALLRKTK